ncbi:hypothetical protein AB0D08_21700 [Kitasatospora sp. NPDC048540]|uniref:hypothetical protein n=1 Tax=unclassified Kitasatospora TaxID=2633591 RepID=UPI00068CD03D|nr:hypothetical protein [Kitasatospora sp. MBT63]
MAPRRGTPYPRQAPDRLRPLSRWRRRKTPGGSASPPGGTSGTPAGSTRATTALHAVRLAAAILHPVVPGTDPPPFPDDTARLLQLIANWRDAVLDLGEFAPAGPVLRIIPGGRES